MDVLGATLMILSIKLNDFGFWVPLTLKWPFGPKCHLLMVQSPVWRGDPSMKNKLEPGTDIARTTARNWGLNQSDCQKNETPTSSLHHNITTPRHARLLIKDAFEWPTFIYMAIWGGPANHYLAILNRYELCIETLCLK